MRLTICEQVARGAALPKDTNQADAVSENDIDQGGCPDCLELIMGSKHSLVEKHEGEFHAIERAPEESLDSDVPLAHRDGDVCELARGGHV